MNCRAFGPVALAFGALALSACGRQSSKPDAEMATGDQPRDHFVVVTGCLRPGETDNTFVLTTAKSEGDAKRSAADHWITRSAHSRIGGCRGPQDRKRAVARSVLDVDDLSAAKRRHVHRLL